MAPTSYWRHPSHHRNELLLPFQPPQLSERIAEVNLAVLVGPDRHAGDRRRRAGDRAVGYDFLRLLVVLEAPNLAAHVVRIHIVAHQVWQPLAAIDEAAGD